MPQTKLGKAMEFFDALVEVTDREGNRLVDASFNDMLDESINLEKQGIEFTKTPDFKNTYLQIVKHKIKHTPTEFVKNLKTSGGKKLWGEYAHPTMSPSGMSRISREADEFTHPFRSSRNPDIYTFLESKSKYVL